MALLQMENQGSSGIVIELGGTKAQSVSTQGVRVLIQTWHSSSEEDSARLLEGPRKTVLSDPAGIECSSGEPQKVARERKTCCGQQAGGVSGLSSTLCGTLGRSLTLLSLSINSFPIQYWLWWPGKVECSVLKLSLMGKFVCLITIVPPLSLFCDGFSSLLFLFLPPPDSEAESHKAVVLGLRAWDSSVALSVNDSAS